MLPIRILVLEDSTLFREFILSTLGKESAPQIICEVTGGLEAVQKAPELQPVLILQDIEPPKLSGIEAARRIRKPSPRSKILFGEPRIVF
jgi:two-component system chemotaxis response regulator CheB